MLSQARKLVVVMGVSGCGKSTVASALSEELGLPMIEADDYHSPQAKQQMASGVPLTDTQRLPWIRRLQTAIAGHSEDNTTALVLAFSGLRAEHRQALRDVTDQCLFLHLTGPLRCIADRLAWRSGHFMPANLLDSQFAALQSTATEYDVVKISVDQLLDKMIIEASQTVQDWLASHETTLTGLESS